MAESLVNKKEKDSKKIELKAGLEIHQQLDSGKLFCRCPSILRNEKGDWIVKRKLHAVAGESGEVDLAAKHEAKKEKEFVYEGFRDSCCLVEFDECPPFEIDKEALKIVVQVALFLNCEIIPFTQIMRKTVINGSNTSGFQRTCLIAKDGFLETSFGRVGIATVCLEEDAAREMGREGNSVIYRLDRLGIPLVEIATTPEIYFPEQVKEAALKIGEILRACRVKRGIGTIRQDVNISIPGSERVEIKGFQEPSIMIKTVELEMQRQKKMLEIHEKIKKLKKIPEKITDLTEIFKKTECKFVKAGIEKQQKVLGVKISGFEGIFGEELYVNRRFGTEVSDYAKMFGVGGIIHSDENLKEKYNFSEKEIEGIKKELEINEKNKDAFIIIIDGEFRAKKALVSAVSRINMAIASGSVKEVRKSNDDGTTSFLRPMPGADRMYPETDLPLLKISRDFINGAKEELPKMKSELKEELKIKGLSAEMINIVLDSGMLKEYESMLRIYGNTNFVAKLMFVLPKEIASHEKLSEEKMNELFNLDLIENILKAISGKIINEDDVKHVFESIAKGKTLEQSLRIEKVDGGEVESEIAKIIREKPGLNANAYMGLVMAKFKGKVSGKEVIDIISKLIK